jgi:rhodanese-related sulfurtransferase
MAGMLAFAAPAVAEDEVRISADLLEFQVETPDGPVTIKRVQDEEHEVTGYYAMTSRKCPPFCIQPVEAAPGVQTIGELELVDLMRDPEALLIDARTMEWHLKETIPGSVNIPYTEVASRLDELGCEKGESGWSCESAKTVALYCNGLWCGQSPTAIRAMLREGYPADKILYYRGGMQSWKVLGFNTIEGMM